MQASREDAKHAEERRALSLSPLSGTESEMYAFPESEKADDALMRWLLFL